MSSLMFIFMSLLGVVYAAYKSNAINSRRQKTLVRRLEQQGPKIDYDYNKFNTKDERNTDILLQNDQLIITTDIQNIRIGDELFISKISSEYNGSPLVFDIVIQPFDKVLFEIEGYKNFNQEGGITTLVVWSDYKIYNRRHR